MHPGSSSLTIFTDIVVDTDTFRIYNNHLQSFRLRRVEGTLLSEITGEVQEGSMDEITGYLQEPHERLCQPGAAGRQGEEGI